MLLQGVVYSSVDVELLRKIYPLVFHAPLLLLLYFLTRKFFWPGVSILTAYLCCQLRRWIALFVVEIFSGGAMLQELLELLLTLPLLWILLRFVAPAVRNVPESSSKNLWQFGIIPAVYYFFDYWSRIYTYLLTSGVPVAVEFMPFVCCVAYLVFLLYNSSKERRQNEMKQVQKTLDLQLNQAVREINTLRESQESARRYRHDLRHHLQYLSACMKNGEIDTAQDYISGICREIEGQKVLQYCENEATNLILSAFAGRAERAGIRFTVNGALPAFIPVRDSDLCVLLSNALENALHACMELTTRGINGTIDVQFFEREEKFFLQIQNPCGAVRMEKGLPVSDRPGHGIGVQSICAIVERYRGVYSFSVQDGIFILRLSI